MAITHIDPIIIIIQVQKNQAAHKTTGLSQKTTSMVFRTWSSHLKALSTALGLYEFIRFLHCCGRNMASVRWGLQAFIYEQLSQHFSQVKFWTCNICCYFGVIVFLHNPISAKFWLFDRRVHCGISDCKPPTSCGCGTPKSWLFHHRARQLLWYADMVCLVFTKCGTVHYALTSSLWSHQ